MSFPRVSLGRPRLSAVIAISFICLTVPALAFILLFGFRQNTAGIITILHEQVALARRVGVDNAENLIEPVAGTLRLLAATAEQNPGLFRTEQSRELLYRGLTAAPQVDAVYASFVDGYHRVVTRVDNERRRSDPQIRPPPIGIRAISTLFSPVPTAAATGFFTMSGRTPSPAIRSQPS